MNYYQKAKDLFGMVESGKLLEALDKYYHKDVLIVADDGKKRNGIDEAREYDKTFLKEIDEIYGGGILSIASDEIRGITIVEFWIDVKFKNGYKKKIEEVAVQNWNGEYIIKENFYSKK